MPRRLSMWRPVGASGDYPDWLRDLKAKRGVYAIRYASSGRIAWVGHSTSTKGGLYKTITRHFQHWEREGRSARASYSYERGDTYSRGNAEVAVWVAPSKTADATVYDLETALVCELDPEDNEQKRNWCEKQNGDVPF